MLKMLCAAHSVYLWLWRNSILKYMSQPAIAKKSIKPLFWCLRSFKVIVFCANSKRGYRFLLVIRPNGNLGSISRRFRDTATYWLKVANFSYFHPLHLAPLAGIIPLKFPEKLYGSWSYRNFSRANSENFVILASAVLIQSQSVTCGHTDASTIAKTRKAALHAVERKKLQNTFFRDSFIFQTCNYCYCASVYTLEWLTWRTISWRSTKRQCFLWNRLLIYTASQKNPRHYRL